MSGGSLAYGAQAGELVRLLSDTTRSVRVAEFPRSNDSVDAPGVYAWFVDADGATALSTGLGVGVGTGLIYGGQAGAGLSSATLRSRILGNHIRGNVTASTFRLTVAAILAGELGFARDGGRALAGDGEQRLSNWLGDHLRVAIAPVADRARLAILEAVILAELDPPLNLQGMAPSAIRAAVRGLRRRLTPRATYAKPGGAPVVAGVPTMTGQVPDMRTFLSGLVGRTIPTLSGRLNRIIGFTGETVLVVSSKSPQGRPVPLGWIQDAADRLFAQGELGIDVATVGYRSAFVGAALAALPGTRVDVAPRRVVVVNQEWPPSSS